MIFTCRLAVTIPSSGVSAEAVSAGLPAIRIDSTDPAAIQMRLFDRRGQRIGVARFDEKGDVQNFRWLSARIKSKRGPRSIYAEPHANASIPKANLRGAKDIVFLGDSLTFGWVTDGKAVRKEEWRAFQDKVRILDFGIIAGRSSHVLWGAGFLGAQLEVPPKIVVLNVGTNNNNLLRKEIDRDTALEAAAGTLAILVKLRKTWPQAHIVVMGIFPRGRDKTDPSRQRNEETVQIVRAALEGVPGSDRVELVDIGEQFVLDDEAKTLRVALFRTKTDAEERDYIHLNSDGYRVWARSLAPRIEKLLSDPPLGP